MLLSAYAASPVAAGTLPVKVAVDPEVKAANDLGAPADPVRLDGCVVRGTKGGWVRIVFANQREFIADEVIFLVAYNGAERRLLDVGRFSSAEVEGVSLNQVVVAALAREVGQRK